MSWVIYLKFHSTGNFYANWTLNSLLYLCIFLRWCLLLYQLIIHACSEADFRENIFFLQFFLQVLFYSVKCQDGLLLWPDGCSLDDKMTRLNSRCSAECLCGIPCQDGSVMSLDGYPTRLSIVLSALALPFSRFFLVFLVSFFRGFSHNLGLFCPFLSFFSLLGILVYTLSSFQLF
jgi:hypothetical protein